MKKLAMTAVLLLSAVGSAFAQDFERGVFNHYSANVSAGTEGIGIGVASCLTPYVETELGINFMPGFKVNGSADIDQQDVEVYVPQTGTTQRIPIDAGKVDLQGNFSRTTLNFKAHVYPFGGNSKFFVSAGFSFGGKKIAKIKGHSDKLQDIVENQYPQYKDEILSQVGAAIADYNIHFDDNYDVSGDVRVKSFRPYLGLGFGRLVTKNRVGVRFEMGCQFMGKMKVYQNNEEVDIYGALDDAGEGDLSKVIEKLKVYPVVKLAITGRIL